LPLSQKEALNLKNIIYIIHILIKDF
jgi:hypothetical protein